MLLQNLHWYSNGKDGTGDLRITNGAIEEIGRGLAPRKRERGIDLRDFLALPGLINAHDHFEWNLVPIPGHPPYKNFSAYAAEVHQPDESPIRELLSVDFRDRLLWGGFKNLISGVTTVCHHNPYDPFFERNFPVRVVEDVGWSHSLEFSTNVLKDFQRARRRPFIIHAAEGTDRSARSEISELQRLGVLLNNTVIVHGIALGETEIALLEKAGAGLIWCPASNLQMFGQTAPISRLRGRVRFALGTDSSLTGVATLFDELRVAYRCAEITQSELLQLVTTSAAEILKLPAGAGTLQPGAFADIIVLADNGETAPRTLLQSSPKDLQLVTIGGQINLAGPAIDGLDANVMLEGHPKYLRGRLLDLKRRIAKAWGPSIADVAMTPLWEMIQPIASGHESRKDDGRVNEFAPSTAGREEII